MTNKVSKLLLGLGLIGISNVSIAQTATGAQKTVNTITTAVPFLSITPDSRSGAMGDVGIAISPDANGMHYNVGKMAFADKKYGGSLNYTQWLRGLNIPDIFIAYLGGYAKFGENDNQAVSGALRFFNLGSIDYTNDLGHSTGTGLPREMSLDFGYSRKFSENLSGGLALKYIYSNIAANAPTTGETQKPGQAVAADLGFFYTNTTEIDEFRQNKFNAGIALKNLGSKISYSNLRQDYLPANLGIGVSHEWGIDEYNSISVGLDINKLLVPTPQKDSAGAYYIPIKPVVGSYFSSFGDAPGGFSEELREYQLSLGAEYWYQKQFALRAGYFYEDKLKGNRKYFTVGVGVKYKAIGINFAYIVPSGQGANRNPLSNSLRVSFVFDGGVKVGS